MRDMIEKLEELNKEKVNEDLGDMAREAEKDHEVQMARSDLYKAAKYAVSIHKMLKDVSEMEGIDGWVAAKITKAADYLGSVKHYMEGEMMQDVELAVVPVAGDMTDAMDIPQESVEEVHEDIEVTEAAERMIKVTNVEWDADNPADVADLPTDFTLKVDIPYNADEDEVDEIVSDAITDRYGFTHKGFEMKFAEDIEEEDVIGNLIGKLGLDKAGKRTGKDEIGDIIAKLPKNKMPTGPAPRPENPVTKQKQANAAAKMPSAPPARPERPRSMAQDTTASLSTMKNWSKN